MGKRKNRYKPLKNLVFVWGRMGAIIVLSLARVIPLKNLYQLGEVLGTVGYYLMRKRKHIAYHNLKTVFGSLKTEKECNEIVKTIFCDAVNNALEIAKVACTNPVVLKEMVSIEGLEYLNDALSQGKGTVAISAHMGNFLLIGPRLIIEGYPFSLIARDPKDKVLAHTLLGMRTTLGLESIPDQPRKVCVVRSLVALKRNRILYLQLDQNASSQDLWVDFFGWLVPTFRGPVVFSMRTGAPITPMFIVRDTPYHHRLIITPPLQLESTDNKENDILRNTANLTKLIESYIQQYPTQWWWFHRRWKKAKKII